MIDQKFSKPIFADEDGYEISCREIASQHIAEQLTSSKTAVELCCAVGVTTIQLSKKIDKVYGVDINKFRINCAIKNAGLYGVDDKVEFIIGDVLEKKLLNKIKAEVAILDPDWSVLGTKRVTMLTIQI